MAPQLAGLEPPGIDMKALIAALLAEDPFCPAPPNEAAEWHEAKVRAWFDAGGVDAQPSTSGLTITKADACPKTLSRDEARPPGAAAQRCLFACPPARVTPPVAVTLTGAREVPAAR